MKRSEIFTLQDAKQYIAENIDKGVACPCCDQLAKMYARKLNTGMAYSLIKVARAYPNGEWVHVENFSKSSSKAA